MTNRLRTSSSFLILGIFIIFLSEIHSQGATPGQNTPNTTPGGTTTNTGQNPSPVNPTPAAPPAPERSIVLIRAVKRFTKPDRPYAIPEILETRSSGIILKNKMILTDLETVRYAVSIEVRKSRDGVPFAARIAFLGIDCGLAFLIVENDSFFQDTSALDFEKNIPSPGAIVSLYGFESQSQSAIARQYPVIGSAYAQIDNSDIDRRKVFYIQMNGNNDAVPAGGAVVVANRISGILHIGRENRSYVIHSDVIVHALDDIADGRYDGFAVRTFTYSPVENEFLQKYTGLKTNALNGGLIVQRIAASSPARAVMQPGDIIYKLGTYFINAAGEVVTETEKTNFDEYLNKLQSDKIWVSILRRGVPLAREITLPLTADPASLLMRKGTDPARKYFLSAGLVFQELDYDLMNSTDVGRELTAMYRYHCHLEDSIGEMQDTNIVLTGILSDSANTGSEIFVNKIVSSLNGRPVRNMLEFAREWKSAQTRYLVIKFADMENPLVILNSSLEETDRNIEKRYNVQENGRVR